MSTATAANPLKTKQHFQILDGLRGVAAISVVIFHFMEIAQPDYEKNFIGHSFLAVDFFFVYQALLSLMPMIMKD
ncbi:acyltransferase family protein [Mucilaginibacter antarcticus]|uniref:acyltransferase family protein n=1 Tax=Mucilaginibacter antarcticus TaxID=1855725 RepID=UPI003638FADE